MPYDVPHDELRVLAKLFVAALAGGAIGWNRQITGKPAGLRTHMLVSLGAALFALIPLEMGGEPGGAGLGRIIQGVAAGVGFLGAGEIFRQPRTKHGEQPVQGLTSAAAIWVTAAIGIGAGCGLWLPTVVATIFTVIILSVAVRLERHLPYRHED